MAVSHITWIGRLSSRGHQRNDAWDTSELSQLRGAPQPALNPGDESLKSFRFGDAGDDPGGGGNPLKRFKGKIALSSENWKMATV